MSENGEYSIDTESIIDISGNESIIKKKFVSPRKKKIENEDIVTTNRTPTPKKRVKRRRVVNDTDEEIVTNSRLQSPKKIVKKKRPGKPKLVDVEIQTIDEVELPDLEKAFQKTGTIPIKEFYHSESSFENQNESNINQTQPSEIESHQENEKL